MGKLNGMRFSNADACDTSDVLTGILQVQELKIDYSRCNYDAPNASDFSGSENYLLPTDLVTAAFKNGSDNINAMWRHEKISHIYRGTYEVQNVSRCTIRFTTPEDMGAPVLFYYRLTNFYQNHRRYVASYYDKQLKGDDVNTESNVKDSSCDPLTVDSDQNNLPYYPCGLIANSLFNDTFFSPVQLNTQGGSSASNVTYVLQNTSNIAWESDNALYGNLPNGTDLSSILPPPNWQRQYPDGKYTTDVPPPDLDNNQAFQVWMRTAGLPTFSKLYARNDTAAMTSGTYEIQILSGMFHGFSSVIQIESNQHDRISYH